MPKATNEKKKIKIKSNSYYEPLNEKKNNLSVSVYI